MARQTTEKPPAIYRQLVKLLPECNVTVALDQPDGLHHITISNDEYIQGMVYHHSVKLTKSDAERIADTIKDLFGLTQRNAADDKPSKTKQERSGNSEDTK